MSNTSNLSRRDAIKLFGSAALFLAAAPHAAFAVSQSQIDAAKATYDQAQQALNALADEVSKKSVILAETQGKIAQVNSEIQTTQDNIAEEEKRLKERQSVLAQRVADNYKMGPSSLLQLVLSSRTFEEFTSNVYYADKISEYDQELIDNVKATKDKLNKQKADLQSQKDSLVALEAQQKLDFDAVQAKQIESQNYVDNLSKEVKDLIAQRDKQLLEAQQAAEEARKAAQNSSKNSGSSSGGGYVPPAQKPSDGGKTGSLAAVLNAARSTSSPGSNLCAAWVSRVFQNAGLGYLGGNACDMYRSWCYSSDRSQLKPGMIIAVSTYADPYGPAGRIYGHVGIYMGGGVVMDNIGRVHSQGLDSWINYYSGLVPVRWGWAYGIPLS